MSQSEPERLHPPASVASIGAQRVSILEPQISRERSEHEYVSASEASTAVYR